MLYTNKWLCSYETLAFNTADGDLNVTQYALTEDGKGYYVRTKPKTEAQFDRVDLTYDISGLTKVNIVKTKAYYDEFLTAVGATWLWPLDSPYSGFDPSQLPSGSVARIPSTANKYNGLRYTPNYPQPTRTEEVSVLPPPEPIPPMPAHGSIALDATSNSGLKSSVSSYSWSHTCSGADRLLVFGQSYNDGVSYYSITNLTYNGVSLTQAQSNEGGDSLGIFLGACVYFLIAPDTGSHTVSVTLNAVVYKVKGGVVSYTGAKQSGQPDAHAGASGNSATISVNVTTVLDNCWVFDAAEGSHAITCGNTQRWNVTQAGGYCGGGADTNGPKTPAGSQTMSWTQSTGYWCISAASFAPVVAKARSFGIIIG